MLKYTFKFELYIQIQFAHVCYVAAAKLMFNLESNKHMLH